MFELFAWQPPFASLATSSLVIDALRAGEKPVCECICECVHACSHRVTQTLATHAVPRYRGRRLLAAAARCVAPVLQPQFYSAANRHTWRWTPKQLVAELDALLVECRK